MKIYVHTTSIDWRPTFTNKWWVRLITFRRKSRVANWLSNVPQPTHQICASYFQSSLGVQVRASYTNLWRAKRAALDYQCPKSNWITSNTSPRILPPVLVRLDHFSLLTIVEVLETLYFDLRRGPINVQLWLGTLKTNVTFSNHYELGTFLVERRTLLLHHELRHLQL
jgi:hypothetical protein